MRNKIGIFLFILSFLGIDATVNYIKKKDNEVIEKDEVVENIKGVYISYIEFYDNFYGGGVTINQARIDKMIDNIVESNFNTIFLHVSPFSDSIYESSIFPYSSTLTGIEGKNPGFDYLDYFIKKAHNKRVKVHAWINPYRISFENNSNRLSKDNPAYKLLNTSSVLMDNNGIYYNPASEITKNLILNQVEEIINNYDVDGIHFDDYFYIQKDIDKIEYESYLKNHGELSLKDFRLMNTNDLIKRVYKKVKEKKNILFSIAPDGNINNNYLYHYADVKTWLSSDEFIDIIMPQIYYGFENEYLSFNKALSLWEEINKSNIKMVPVLAFYKINTVDTDAGSGNNEWINRENIITRQVEIINDKKMFGYSLFRYDYMYNSVNMNEKSVQEMVNLKKIN